MANKKSDLFDENLVYPLPVLIPFVFQIVRAQIIVNLLLYFEIAYSVR